MIQLIAMGLIAAALFYLQKRLYHRLWKRELTVKLTFTSQALFEGEEGQLLEIIENCKRLPLPMLKVKFQTDRALIFSQEQGSRTTDQYYRNDVFHVNGGERVTRTLPFIAGRRGYYQIRQIDLIGSDLLMSCEMMLTVPTDQRLYVYPKPYQDEAFLTSLRELNGEVLSRHHWIEDPFEYRGIREYQSYDDMRTINWKASAKTGEWMVNQPGYTSLKTIRIFINLEDNGVLKKEEAVEASIRIAAGICDFFLRQGVQVSCYCNSPDVQTGEILQIPAGAGSGRMTTIYRALACLDTAQKPYDFATCFEECLFHEAGGSLTCFIAPNQYASFIALLNRYKEAGHRFIWYYPVWEETDPEIPEALRENTRILHIRNSNL